MLRYSGISSRARSPRIAIPGAFLALSALSALSVLGACGASHRGARATPETVEIPQTEVKNQFSMGFCWSYAVIGLIESNHKLRTGQDVDLSEEALGFHRIAEELYALGQRYAGTEALAPALEGASLEGWFVKIPDADARLDTFELLRKYGAVPEAAWSVKFDSRERRQAVLGAIKDAMFRYAQEKRPREITLEDIVSRVMTAPGAFQTRPPETFSTDGRTTTPQTYLREALSFDPDAYTAVTARTPAEYDRMVTVAKRALASGLAVPFTFPISFARLRTNAFSGAPGETTFRLDGHHAVLVTDFINDGGQLGAVSPETLELEVEKPASELRAFYFKNSWGENARSNEAGIRIAGSENGYYLIDRDYMRMTLDARTRVLDGKEVTGVRALGGLSVTVPRALLR